MNEAYVVIDMIKDFMNPDGALYCGEEAEEIIGPIVAQLHVAKQTDKLVVFACDNHEEDDVEFEQFPPHAITKTAGAEVIDMLGDFDGNRADVSKTKFNAFAGTDLDEILTDTDVLTVVLAGVCTDICIKETALGAVAAGYNVVINEDEVASFDAKAHAKALDELEAIDGITVNRV